MNPNKKGMSDKDRAVFVNAKVNVKIDESMDIRMPDGKLLRVTGKEIHQTSDDHLIMDDAAKGKDVDKDDLADAVERFTGDRPKWALQ